MEASKFGVVGRGRSGPASKIMVVEDSPSARKLLQALFLRLGIELPNLRLVATEEEALQMFTQWHPDIVFLDLELRPPPGGTLAGGNDGARPAPKGADLAFQFLKRNPQVKIVVCSARDPADSPVGDLVRSGAIQGLVKPVLAAKVQEALARAAPRTPAAGPGMRR